MLGIVFTPASAGSSSGSIVLADNATPAMQTISLSSAVAGPAAYTVTAKTPTLSISAGSEGTTTLIRARPAYTGTVFFTTTVTSSDGTPADITAAATPVNLTAGGTGTATLTIMANAQAGNYMPSAS